jgi:hypothetical protein
VLNDCNYDKIKMIHHLSKMVGFIDRHAVSDAEKEGHPLCAEEYKELRADLEKHINKLSSAVKGLSKEDKF